MSRLIDAEALCCAISKRVGELMDEQHPQTAGALEGAIHFILGAPTISAAGVVICGQCKFRSDFTDGHCECRRWPNVPMSCQSVDPNFDFCSYGVRNSAAEIKP